MQGLVRDASRQVFYDGQDTWGEAESGAEGGSESGDIEKKGKSFLPSKQAG